MAEPAFQSSISCHSWNKAHNELAISPNTRDVWIFSAKDSDIKKWKQIASLEGHQMRVTGIDWNGTTNSIATSSQDRNAYVWKAEKANEWKPTLVVLRIGRAATCIKWSPNGTKFAVGSGSKQIPICHYEQSQDMWVAKMIKKAGKSSILSVDWSPNNLFIIAGGSDFKCRVFSAYIKGVDTECKVDNYGGAIDAKQAGSFGQALCEFDTSKGWIESCRFSPSGMRFAFTGHDSTVNFGSFDGGKTTVQTIKRRQLPLACISFITDTVVIAAGYDCVPVLYEYNGSQWVEKGPIDTGAKSKAAPKKQKSAFGNAFSKFQNQAKFGDKGGAKNATLPYRHQNMINDIHVQSDKKFTTSSVDGRVLFWDLSQKY
mmetsp:Transcript_16990/g.15247  ORF Transcript_16990/g.15247 Transcript_16990/m.15247 type:complete len:372 (+) Transcript_16990:107-1222(+)